MSSVICHSGTLNVLVCGANNKMGCHLMKSIFRFFEKHIRTSYSQSGEDRIIAYIFDCLQLKSPTYLDIGAHHSSYLSNTYLFYTNGSSGICIEPDPVLFAEIKRKRSRDICLNIGIASDAQTIADFYVMTTSTLNTFSKEEAYKCQDSLNHGKQKIEKVIQIPLRTIDDVMDEYSSHNINLVSVDVEGLDYEIIRSFNFSKHQPEVFCVETISYNQNGILQKDHELIKYMKEVGYVEYSDTYINTIFVSKKVQDFLRMAG